MKFPLRQAILEIVLVVLCIVLAICAPGFLSTENLLKVLGDVSMQGIIAFGMTMVIIAGEIDLSVGSTVAFAGCLTAWITARLTGQRFGFAMVAALLLAVPIAVITSTLAGCFSGFFRVRFRVPTFISTLAWLAILRGAVGLLTNGFAISPYPQWFNFLGAGYVWRIPFPAIIFLAVFLIIHCIMNFTSFGRSVYAVGGNAEAARLSGINVGFVKIAVMAIVSALAAIAGIMLSSRLLSGSPTSGTGWELDVITAVIIGGTSLMGGAGRIWGTLIGVIFLGILGNGMTLLNVSEYWQLISRGILIFAAVLINQAPPNRK